MRHDDLFKRMGYRDLRITFVRDRDHGDRLRDDESRGIIVYTDVLLLHTVSWRYNI